MKVKTGGRSQTLWTRYATAVLAVGTVRGWRSALIGTIAGVGFLALPVAMFGPALQPIPLTTLQLFVGILLLLFGMRWPRKAILRRAGVIDLRNESAIYANETALLTAEGPAPTRTRFDAVAVATSFKAVCLEGLEVIFIVIATGIGGILVPAIIGAGVVRTSGS